MLHRQTIINVEDENEVIQLDGGDKLNELDHESILVQDDIDTEKEELFTDTDTESEVDDDYESAIRIQDDFDSDID